MAKIVVADDNSNIQRMVGLALKDQGIEVVAVGNGEAAVRKISELRPDLVLADVFMPVRNGYEVCQYVKEDSNLAHIPVILLVGAFDPLDESEAQRVGADGVLKKPFVPPDPLIAMVKAALQKAGVSLTPSQEKAAPPAPRRAADLLSPSLPPAQVPPPPRPASPLAGIAFSGSQPFVPVVTDESFVSEPAGPEPVKVEEASSTMAFGDLLRPTTNQEEQSAAQQDDSADDVETVTGADWRSLDEPADVPEEEEEEENSDSAPSWRRDGGDGAFKFDDSEGPSRDWRDSPVLQTAGRKSARETWDTNDAGGFSSAAEVPAEMGAFATELNALEAESVTAAVVQEAPSVIEPTVQETQQVHTIEEPVTAAVATVVPESEPVQELAAVEAPQTAFSTHESVVEHPVEAAVPVSASQISEQETPDIASESVAAPVSSLTETTAASATEHLPEQAPLEQKTAEAPNSWFSRPASPWDTETRASTLATSWDSSAAPAATTRADEPQAVATGQAQIDAQPATQESTPAAASEVPELQTPVSATSAPMAQSDMDVLIAKVLAKMSPDALQAVTKELLKPVVAALVEEELKNKK